MKRDEFEDSVIDLLSDIQTECIHLDNHIFRVKDFNINSSDYGKVVLGLKKSLNEIKQVLIVLNIQVA